MVGYEKMRNNQRGRRRKILQLIEQYIMDNNPEKFTAKEIYSSNRDSFESLGVAQMNFGMIIGKSYVRFGYSKRQTGGMVVYEKQTHATCL